jgi:hypothetical protein
MDFVFQARHDILVFIAFEAAGDASYPFPLTLLHTRRPLWAALC